MSNYLACVITHGALAGSLKAVVEKLVAQAPELHCFSNQESDIEAIGSAIQDLVENRKPDKIIIFVDLMGGSCWLSANRLKHFDENITIAAGVNLPMLVSYCVNYERLKWPELLIKIEADAQKGIIVK